MVNYDNLIQYEEENTFFDFKLSQYHRNVFDSFIKDIMSMANADGDHDRHIVIGVSKKNGERILTGIKKEEFDDPAIYQQIIRENVEPDVHLDYFLHEFQEKFFPIFRISQCSEKPYMMKKRHGSLEKGDAWIRKGTHQDRMVRRDFDLIYEKRTEKKGFSGEIDCFFLDTELTEVSFHTIGEIAFPSEYEKQKIQQEIEKQKNTPYQFLESMKTIQRMNNIFYDSRRYEDFTVQELEKKLESVRSDFYDDDIYEIYEEHGNKLNFTLINHGDEYLENASIKVILPQIEGFLIAEEKPEKPDHSPIRAARVFTSLQYPHMKKYNDSIEISWDIGDIRHQIPTKCFAQSVQIALNDSLRGTTIDIQCVIYGKNLAKPINKKLTIMVS
jgi:hypothetical protein